MKRQDRGAEGNYPENLGELMIDATRDKPNLTVFFSRVDGNKFRKARHRFIGTSHSDMT